MAYIVHAAIIVIAFHGLKYDLGSGECLSGIEGRNYWAFCYLHCPDSCLMNGALMHQLSTRSQHPVAPPRLQIDTGIPQLAGFAFGSGAHEGELHANAGKLCSNQCDLGRCFGHISFSFY